MNDVLSPLSPFDPVVSHNQQVPQTDQTETVIGGAASDGADDVKLPAQSLQRRACLVRNECIRRPLGHRTYGPIDIGEERGRAVPKNGINPLKNVLACLRYG